MASAKSAFLQIFDDETKADDYKFEIKNVQARLSLRDSKDDRPMEFKAGSYKFKYGAALADEFDLKVKLDEIEGDIDALEADQSSANNAASLAAEIVDRQAADTGLQNQITAEVSRATTAEGVNSASISSMDVAYKAADAVLTQAVADAESAAAALVAAEETRALAAEQQLQNQISNILSDADPSTVNSIAELLNHVNSEDASLLAQIAQLQTDHAALLARVDELTNQA